MEIIHRKENDILGRKDYASQKWNDTATKIVEKEMIGVVTTSALNVRSSPEITSENSDGFIVKGTQVRINTNKSTNDFYKIQTKDGDDGYCLKKFIELRGE
jgi:uncharacterized protein YgiM (DUF1202 family)